MAGANRRTIERLPGWMRDSHVSHRHRAGLRTNPNRRRAGIYFPGSGASRLSYRPATERGAAMLCLVAALMAPLPTAASLPDLRSTPPPCDCEGDVLLERQRLLEEHTRSVHALEKTYKSRITQLEGLVAALGGDTNAASRAVFPDLAILPRAALLASDTPIASGRGGVQPTGAVGGPGKTKLRKSAPSRGLLQAEKFCSIDELMSVQNDAAAAVTGMLTTNVGCAMCLVPCASAENAIGCAMECVKQVLRARASKQHMHCAHGTCTNHLRFVMGCR